MAEFISEPLHPEPGSFDASGMARGEAGLPSRFEWRGEAYVVAELLEKWKTSSRAQGELYLRRHWFKVRTVGGSIMTIYCERKPKPTKTAKQRWWVYTVEASAT